MVSNYSIEARSFNIVGAWSHNYWVLRDPDGNIIAELHGLATDRETGAPVPIGTSDRHSLRAWSYVVDGQASIIGIPPTSYIDSGLYQEGQKSSVVYSGDAADVFGRWATAVSAIDIINRQDLDYPVGGINLFSRTVNSNSMFTTFGELMALPATKFSGVIEPGINNLTLPQNVIEAIRSTPLGLFDWSSAFKIADSEGGTSYFKLNIDNALKAAEGKPSDKDVVEARVREGLIGGSINWQISYDPNKLNLNQYQGGWINNTFTAAATQILADGYRPGNGNTVKDVFDFSLRNATQGLSYGSSKFGALLNSGNAQARLTLPTDPLVLDLNGDGVRLTDYVSAPVLFDIDNDGGSLEETGWASTDDGIVVVDRNNNGKIDNISETLSEYFGGAAGSAGSEGEKRFQNGFAALRSLDSNSDNLFDNRDEAWSSVKIWVDANHDGKSWVDANGNDTVDAGEVSELKSLTDLGITSINLANTAQNGEVRDGNEVLARGTFVQDGVTKEAIAANFLANPNGHTFSASGNGTIVSTQGGGQVAPVSAYASTSISGETIDVVQKGVNNATGGAGNDVLLGDAGTNWLAGGQGSDTFHAGAGDDVLLIDADDSQLNIHGGDGTDIVQIIGDQDVMLNLTQAEIEIAQGGRGNDVFIGGGLSTVYMRGGDGDDILIGGAASDALSGENGDDWISGGAGNDVLRGHRGSDDILGGLGNDLIDGGLDDDNLSGGADDDVLIGGAGDDTINGGDGLDVVELSGDFADYRLTRTAEGVWISDTVAGRDGTDFLQNIEKANFKNLKLVEIPTSISEGMENPLLVKDVLSRDKTGVGFERTSAHLIGKEQLLQNDIDWQHDALHITGLFDVVGGTASVTQAGDVLFTPDATFTGIMGFKYTVADAKGNEASTIANMGTGESATMRAAVYLKTSDLPDDPLVTDQWYLSQANILPVWKDYTGKGVRIVQIETNSPFGTTKEILDYRHADLKDNIDQNWLANAAPGQMAGEGSGGKFSDHATLVAGVMVAARNGEGSVGVAYDASIAGYWVNKDDFSNMSHMYEYDVVNNSWGSNNHFDLKFSPAELGNMPTAYHQALKEGRDGLGTVIVTAGGNDREKGGNTNYSNVTNSRSSIIVGAINATTDLGALQLGGKPFSSPGASILVSAPGSNVTSTSRLVQNDNGSTFGGDTSVSQGTSFAAPIVSGIVALMLEANPELGYRDVQQILALSARKVADPATFWQDNGGQNWNGGGMHVSHDYGYGEVDARAAVRLAETWSIQQTFHNEFSLAQPLESGVLNRAIADGQDAGVSHSLTMGNVDISVEHVEVKVSLTHSRPGDLILKLISPSGTESILMNRPGKVPGSAVSDRGDTAFAGESTLNYVFDTALLRGESVQGNWTLQVIDTVTGDTGTLNNWSLNVYGKNGTFDDQYVYTNEYAQLAAASGRNVLNDTDGGLDTINAAAIASASLIDLSKGEATLAGAHLTIANPGQIENLIGGEFGDSLMGNGADNHLSGGRGNDLLSGGVGVDALIGGQGNDTLTGGANTDYFVIDKVAGDSDTLTDFVIGTDRIVLSGFDADVYSSMNISQQGADTRLALQDGQVLLLKNVQAQALTLSSFVHVPEGVNLNRLERYSGFGFGLDGTVTERSLPDTTNGFLYWANDGGERVFGGTGADAIFGGLGDDVLVGESSTTSTIGGNDVLNGGNGSDVVRGGAGDDVLYGGAGLDYLGGDAGNDVLYLEGDQGIADFGTTTLLSPNINLAGAASHTGASVAGGVGNDRFVVVEDLKASASQGIMANLIDDFEVANPNEKIDLSQTRAVHSFAELNFSTVTVDGETYLRVWLGAMASGTQYLTLKGVSANQLTAANFIFGQAIVQPKVLLSGTEANDLLVGDAGGNTLDGGAGADVLEGRTGDDTYIVDNAGDVIKEVVGGGYDLVKSSVSHLLADEVESLQLQGSASIDGTGNGLVNRLAGNSANNVLDGAGGSDVLIGGLGDDTYVVDDGSDRIVESDDEGTDTVRSSVSFTLANHLENLTLTASAEINATGNTANNILRGNIADNRLDGAQGADLMVGGMGNDTYFVDNTGDVVVEDIDSGNDKVISTIDFTLEANVEVLALSGSALNGSGNELANELFGNERNNRLYGAAGDDFLQGGKGDDRYVFGTGHGQDRINEDLDASGGIDTIVFEAGIEESDVAVDHSGQGMVLRLNDGQQIVSGWTASGGHAIERIEFANGKVWDTAALSTQTNRAPILSTAIADQSAAEDSRFVYTLPADTFADLDAGDSFKLSAWLPDGKPLPAWLTFDAATRTFSGTPTNGEVGALSILVTATDKAGLTISDSFDVRITNSNDAPMLAETIADQAATEDAPFSFILPAGTFSDVDAGDALILTAKLVDGQPLPAWLSFDAVTRTFSGTPADENVGALSVLVTATDKAGLSVSDAFDIRVANVNEAPVLAEVLADQAVTENTLFSFTLSAGAFSDVDAGDALTLTAKLADGQPLPAWLSFDAATRTFSGTPENDAVGSLSIRVTATDKAGLSVSDSFEVQVSNTNDAPILVKAIADQSATEGALLTFALPATTFADLDVADALSITAQSADGQALPDWLSYDAVSRTFSGTPDNANVGKLSIRVQATDKAGATVSDIFEIDVQNVNNAPAVGISIADQVAGEDTQFSYTVPANSFSDIDAGDSLSLVATTANGGALPGWLIFDRATRTFSGVPTNSDVGLQTIKVTATDQAGATTSDVFILTVANANDAPQLVNAVADLNIQSGQTLSYVLPANTFADIDAGDQLSYQATLANGSALPAWLVFDAATRTFSGTPTDTGVVSVKVSAVDLSAAVASDVFDIVVSAQTVINGTQSGETLNGDALGNIINGLGGNDSLYGLDGNDVLNGGDGVDWLYGGDGNDTLDGGAGNDRLSGNFGNDTYRFYRGMGQDNVTDHDWTARNVDTIKVAADIAPADVLLSRTSSDITLSIKGTADKLSITFFNNANYQVERVEFADGTVWGIDTLKEMTKGVASSAADTLFGDTGADVLDGLEGDDKLYGEAGDDRLEGGAGKDSLDGGDGNDVLNGGVGNDSLGGGNGNDRLDGGADNDRLGGASGNDTYMFYRGMGQDVISEFDSTTGNSDTIKVAADINPGDVIVKREGTDVYLAIKNTTDRMTIYSYTDSYYQVERVEFADGTVWSVSDLKRLSLEAATNGADTLYGDESSELLEGLDGNDRLYGLAGNDVLKGGVGDDMLDGSQGLDTLDGGAGNDSLHGGSGNDTYLFQRGDGQDLIFDRDWTTGNIDVIKLAQGISPSDIKASRVGDNLELAILGTSDKLTIRDWFYSADSQIEQLQFADGTLWNVATLKTMVKGVASEGNDVLQGDESSADTLNGLGGDDTLYGLSGNDTLNGGTGKDKLYGGAGADALDGGVDNDTLYGDAGNDTYLFYRGAGQDWISDYDSSVGNLDVIKVAAGLNPSDIQLSRDLSNLYVGITGTTDKLTISGWFSNSANQIEQIQFADGTTWNASTIKGMTKGTATSGNDVLFGEEALADSLSGLDGDDKLYGLGGNDILSGGGGADELNGGAGSDTLSGGTGNDRLNGDRGNDLYQFERGGGQDVIDDFDPDANTDVLQFGAGISADQLWFRKNGWDLEVSVIGTADKVTISQWSFWSAGSWEKAQHIEQFRTADGKVLLENQVDQLVNAMAAFAPPTAGQTSLPSNYHAALDSVIAANWQ